MGCGGGGWGGGGMIRWGSIGDYFAELQFNEFKLLVKIDNLGRKLPSFCHWQVKGDDYKQLNPNTTCDPVYE